MRETINRRWVANRIRQGKVEVKCLFHYTDDYAYDNAVNCGKMDNYLPAYFGVPGEYKENQVIFYDDDFSCYGDKNSIFRIRVHSNLVFDARIINTNL